MNHKMGLVRLDMTTGKSVSNTVTYTYTTSSVPTPVYSGTATIYPEHSFTSASGYCYPLNAATASTDCYYIVKSTGSSTSSSAKFGCSTTNTTEYWSDFTMSGIGYGKCSSKKVESVRNAKNFVATFAYCGACQTVTLPWYGKYKMECWGANGGKGLAQNKLIDNGGRGGYTSGTITLLEGRQLFMYVGGVGSNAKNSSTVDGGWNGGGKGCPDGQDDEAAGGGGGATDIRIVSGTWDNVPSLCSRIMVAGGGGGGSYGESSSSWFSGGCGGGTKSGYPSEGAGDYFTAADGALSDQTTGYQFGKGQDGVRTVSNNDVGGGGGGYYGGVTSRQDVRHNIWDGAPGYGGSGFISGHNGCNAISASVTTLPVTHSGSSVHYSGLKFDPTEMIDGKGYVWTSTSRPATATKLSIITSNPGGGNGYAKITSQ